ncbi:methylated-DNA--[protein]-cysteine S-methyltransferase [Metallosphaera tengchongensis]|uniref:Methylated-DNA--protein-cysteine methyltransferase n=1 Tax=Metallosphaera tengchongensis TaxID=1532350 RepID=A0A6N0NVT9_9CREN|nr:methylated-DNA--[protein]-cysteine S-methyltransferase [Metallosphaera tengchongensis]QKQ99250.1 methylated-DNA--[protein]-cysteine S-methyltransferase [Metallosphaera tengchongensis]
MIVYGIYESPIGPITVASEDNVITMLDFCNCTEKNFIRNEEFKDLFERLDSYFRGNRVEFYDIPVKYPMNPFRARVFKEIRKLRWGEIKTYGMIAERLGTSPRAIGMALSKNDILLLIPCHRVVAENGIGGYSRGILIKRKLLELEGIKL